jgi:hypothetical protein
VCPSKGGFPQDCVDVPTTRGGGSVCLIGLFGTPCTSDAGCINGLSCLAPLTLAPNVRICSFDCATHADCQSNPLAGAQSYCVGEVLTGQQHVCAPQLDALGPCIADVQCKSGMCNCANPPCSATNLGLCAAATGGG